MIRQFPPEDQKSAQRSIAARREFLAKVSFLQTFFQMQQSFCNPETDCKEAKVAAPLSKTD
jgi:hypothetical protein